VNPRREKRWILPKRDGPQMETAIMLAHKCSCRQPQKMGITSEVGLYLILRLVSLTFWEVSSLISGANSSLDLAKSSSFSWMVDMVEISLSPSALEDIMRPTRLSSCRIKMKRYSDINQKRNNGINDLNINGDSLQMKYKGKAK
jgi:hypothetical protein